MAKRVLISILLVAVLVAVVAGASSLIFSSQYSSLQALENELTASDDEATTQVVLTDGTAPSPVTTEKPTMLEDYGSVLEEAAAPAPVQAPVNSSAVQDMLNSMTLEEKIYQMLFVTPEALTGYNKVIQSGNATRSALESCPVGGIIYFADNLISVAQTTEMIANIQAFSTELTGRGLFIGVDEEGGSVARVADTLGTTAFDDMATYGATGDADAVYNLGLTQAQELTALGFNVNFSPVADVLTNEENTVVKDRSFGSDADLVSNMVTSVISGLTDGGMLASPKHFPGHGSTGGDTHNGYASSDRTLQQLNDCDLKPFWAAIQAGTPMIMVGHMTMTQIDPDRPACLSPTIVTDILREQLGYNGIIITDALNMSAITDHYSYSDAAIAAISAGCDMLLCVSNIETVVSSVAAAVEEGTIQESQINASVTRILTAKYQYGIIS